MADVEAHQLRLTQAEATLLHHATHPPASSAAGLALRHLHELHERLAILQRSSVPRSELDDALGHVEGLATQVERLHLQAIEWQAQIDALLNTEFAAPGDVAASSAREAALADCTAAAEAVVASAQADASVARAEALAAGKRAAEAESARRRAEDALEKMTLERVMTMRQPLVESTLAAPTQQLAPADKAGGVKAALNEKLTLRSDAFVQTSRARAREATTQAGEAPARTTTSSAQTLAPLSLHAQAQAGCALGGLRDATSQVGCHSGWLLVASGGFLWLLVASEGF